MHSCPDLLKHLLSIVQHDNKMTVPLKYFDRLKKNFTNLFKPFTKMAAHSLQNSQDISLKADLFQHIYILQ